MVAIASITGSSCHPRNEVISRIQLALRYVKRQICLIDESAQCILWQLREVQRLESLGETDLPITVPELIKKLIVLESEINLIVKAMATITVSLCINDKGRNKTITTEMKFFFMAPLSSVSRSSVLHMRVPVPAVLQYRSALPPYPTYPGTV
jgi:hypothetical protein